MYPQKMSKFTLFLWSFTLFFSISQLIDGQQRTHFPKSTGQSKIIQCPLNTDCRSIVQCANQQELRLNPRKLNYCGWRHGLPMICCAVTKSRNKLFERDDLVRQLLPRLKPGTKESRKNTNFEICGTRIKQISMYIVGGSHVVSPTKYPWFASIALVKDESYLDNADKDQANSNLHHYCGSTILTDRFLISSAHCFPISGVDELDLANYRIALGDVELSSEKMQIHELEQVIIHPNASTDHHYSDIALLKLKRPLTFSSRVRPVCLPFLDFGELADDTRGNSRDNPTRDNSTRNEKTDESKKEEDKEKHGRRPDDSNKFDSPERELFGFSNPNYQPNRESSFKPPLPFYGFANPNYNQNYSPSHNQNYSPNYSPNSGLQPNQDERRSRRPTIQRRYPYAGYSYNNFYPVRSKRSNVLFEDELYDELFTRPNVKVSIAGYGDTQFMGTRSPALKEAELMIVNRAKCNELYAKLNSTSLRQGLTGEFVCAADKRLAKEFNSDLLDARIRRIRTKRSIRYWVNYFSDRIKESQERRKNLSRSGGLTDKSDQKDKTKNRREDATEKDKRNKAVNKLDLKKDDEYDKDLVNVLSEEELREKLTGLSDACQGDSGGGMYVNFDMRNFNKTISEYRGDALVKERLRNKFEPIYEKLERKGLEGKFYLTSIVAFGINCGANPGVYLNLDYHKRWILDNIDLDGSKFTL